jgi:hypothetical protein
MAEWLEDHMAAIGSLNSSFHLVDRTGLNWRPGGPLGGKWRPLVGKVGEWYVESQHVQGCSPCLCQLRIDGLAPKSKY